MTTKTTAAPAQKTLRAEWIHLRLTEREKLDALRVARRLGHADNISAAVRVLIARAAQADTRQPAHP